MTREQPSLAAWTRSIAASSAQRSVTVQPRLSRRDAMRLMGAVGAGVSFGISPLLRAQVCEQPARTPIEGPYYLGDPEERNDTGSDLVVRGRVVDALTCAPVPHATVVRWHANDVGFYEELYRARMSVSADGEYALSTIAPGQYANLDRHIHWYVMAQGYEPLLAQLQWPNGAQIAPEETFDFSLRPLMPP